MIVQDNLHQNIVNEVLHHHPFYNHLHLYHQIYTNVEDSEEFDSSLNIYKIIIFSK